MQRSLEVNHTATAALDATAAEEDANATARVRVVMQSLRRPAGEVSCMHAVHPELLSA